MMGISLKDRTYPPLEWVNWGIVAAFVFAMVFQLWLLPVYLLSSSGSWLWGVLPLMLINNTLWAVVHEGTHSNLSRNRARNDLMARIAGICLGSPFRGLQVAHLAHHRYNRTPFERHEIYDPGMKTRFQARTKYYFQLLVGVYLQELLMPLLLLLPKKTFMAVIEGSYPHGTYGRVPINALLCRPKQVTEARVDVVIIYAMLAAGFWNYGRHWPVLVFLLGFRALCISMANYVYHYGTEIDQIISGWDIYLPRPLAVFLMNSNYHLVHHEHPGLPWHALHEKFETKDRSYDGHYAPRMIRQLRGLTNFLAIGLIAASALTMTPVFAQGDTQAMLWQKEKPEQPNPWCDSIADVATRVECYVDITYLTRENQEKARDRLEDELTRDDDGTPSAFQWIEKNLSDTRAVIRGLVTKVDQFGATNAGEMQKELCGSAGKLHALRATLQDSIHFAREKVSAQTFQIYLRPAFGRVAHDFRGLLETCKMPQNDLVEFKKNQNLFEEGLRFLITDLSNLGWQANVVLERLNEELSSNASTKAVKVVPSQATKAH